MVTITPISDHQEYKVNMHIVYKDGLANWVCKTDMSTKETAAFRRYEKLVINNTAFKKHTKATYKI